MPDHNHTVLVVEDNRDTQEALRLFLELRGFAVRTADDGGEALAALHAGVRPCVVILDWNMPGVDGRTFCGARRHTPELAGLPVVVLSASATACQEARQYGVEACFTKPLDPDEIAAFIERYCDRSEAA
jgi:CheY-like chemotaxis protein